MASLIDELIDVLEKETQQYKELITISSEKTGIIVKNDIETLRQITAREQDHLSVLVNLEKKREEVTSDIALVMNIPLQELNLRKIIDILSTQKEVQLRLSRVHDDLKATLKYFGTINERNKKLIQESLEFIDFNLNYIKGMYQAPEVANYTKDAFNASPKMDLGVFDAKQ